MPSLVSPVSVYRQASKVAFGATTSSHKPPSEDNWTPNRVAHDFAQGDTARQTGMWLKEHPRDLASLIQQIPDLPQKTNVLIAKRVAQFHHRTTQLRVLTALLSDNSPQVVSQALHSLGSLVQPKVQGQKAWFQPVSENTSPGFWAKARGLLAAKPQQTETQRNYLERQARAKFYDAHYKADADKLALLEHAALNPLFRQGPYAESLKRRLAPFVLSLQTTRLTQVPSANGANTYLTQKQMTELLTRQVNLLTQLSYPGQPSWVGQRVLGLKPHSQYVSQLAQQVRQAPVADNVKTQLLQTLGISSK